MANRITPMGSEKFLTGGINLETDTIKAILLAQAPGSVATLADLEPYRIGTDQTLVSKTVANGVFDSDNLTWTNLVTNATAVAVAFYRFTGDPATSVVFQIMDSIQGFPRSTSDGQIVVTTPAGVLTLVP